jgi:hypothetical protein
MPIGQSLFGFLCRTTNQLKGKRGMTFRGSWLFRTRATRTWWRLARLGCFWVLEVELSLSLPFELV